MLNCCYKLELLWLVRLAEMSLAVGFVNTEIKWLMNGAQDPDREDSRKYENAKL